MITEGAIFKVKNKGTSFLWSWFWAEVSSDLKSTVAVSKYRSIQYSGSVSVALLVEIYGSYDSPSNPIPKPNLTLRDSLRHTGRENTLSDRYRYLQILHVAVSVVVLNMNKISLLVSLESLNHLHTHWECNSVFTQISILSNYGRKFKARFTSILNHLTETAKLFQGFFWAK